MKSPIRGAASSANRFAAQPTKARGSSGDAALRDAYRRVASGRSDLAAEPLSVLTKSRRHRARAGELVFWMHVLDGDGDEARTQLADLDNASVDLASALELAEHPETASLSDMVQRIGSESTIEAIGPMLVFVNRCGRLRELIGLVADATTMDRLREVERLTLDFGLSDEQVIVSSILISRAAALDPNDG